MPSLRQVMRISDDMPACPQAGCHEVILCCISHNIRHILLACNRHFAPMELLHQCQWILAVQVPDNRRQCHILNDRGDESPPAGVYVRPGKRCHDPQCDIPHIEWIVRSPI